MLNLDNFGIVNGTLQADPVILKNKDGSKKILMTVLCSDMTRDRNGNRTFQSIPVQGFIPKTYNGIGPYEFLKMGDEVHVEYSIKANPYQGENAIIMQIDSIKFGKDIKAHIQAGNKQIPTNKPDAKEETKPEAKSVENESTTTTPVEIEGFEVNEDLDFDLDDM